MSQLFHGLARFILLGGYAEQNNGTYRSNQKPWTWMKCARGSSNSLWGSKCPLDNPSSLESRLIMELVLTKEMSLNSHPHSTMCSHWGRVKDCMEFRGAVPPTDGQVRSTYPIQSSLTRQLTLELTVNNLLVNNQKAEATILKQQS